MVFAPASTDQWLIGIQEAKNNKPLVKDLESCLNRHIQASRNGDFLSANYLPAAGRREFY
jgi:hypothetical protein